MEFGPAADRNTRCACNRCWSRARLRRPSGLGSDRADADHLRFAALRDVLGVVFRPGAAPCPVDRRSCASAGAGFPATARGASANLRARRDTCGRPLALAHTGTLYMGPCERAGLLADANFAA